MNKKKKTKRLYIQSSAYKRNVHIIIIQSGNAVVRMHSSSSSPCHNHRVIHSGIMFVIHRCVAPPCKCSATQITEYCAKSTKKKKKNREHTTTKSTHHKRVMPIYTFYTQIVWRRRVHGTYEQIIIWVCVWLKVPACNKKKKQSRTETLYSQQPRHQANIKQK